MVRAPVHNAWRNTAVIDAKTPHALAPHCCSCEASERPSEGRAHACIGRNSTAWSDRAQTAAFAAANAEVPASGRVNTRLREPGRHPMPWPIPSAYASRLYEEGPVVKWRSVVRVVLLSRLLVWSDAHVSMASSSGGSGEIGCSLGRKSKKGGQAARRKAAPRGANFSLRESMCQIAWASLRARSTWATLAPRCFPSRRLVRW